MWKKSLLPALEFAGCELTSRKGARGVAMLRRGVCGVRLPTPGVRCPAGGSPRTGDRWAGGC